MDLYSRMLNINGNDNEEELKKCISEVKAKLNNLTVERTCKIYNGMLYDELVKNHVLVNLINTNDLGIDYEHCFVLLSSNTDKLLLADLTFSQFDNQDKRFADLLNKGYQDMDLETLNKYLNIVSTTNLDKEYCIDDFIFNRKRR